MNDEVVRSSVFVAANVVVGLSYLAIGLFIAPTATRGYPRTRVGCVGFFVIGGVSRLWFALGVITTPLEDVRHVSEEWLPMLITILQVVCAYLFITGVYLEGPAWSPWRMTHHEPLNPDEPLASPDPDDNNGPLT